MLHPDTMLGSVSPEIGVGIFATAFIPKGTVIYIKDPLEIVVSPDDVRLRDPAMHILVDRYSYMEANGTRVLSWDLAKYMNHSCDANSVSTGYGFEIAIRDIEVGEEITDDYGLLNIERDMACHCGAQNCRGWIRHNDIERYADIWDSMGSEALAHYYYVSQPLKSLMDRETAKKLQRFLDTGQGFMSVRQLQLVGQRSGRQSDAMTAAMPLVTAGG